jgi:hypothetical protein
VDLDAVGALVVSATATVISSLCFIGITPPANAAAPRTTKALKAADASSPKRANRSGFRMAYIATLCPV